MDMSTRPLRSSNTDAVVPIRREHVEHVGPGDLIIFRLPDGTHIVRAVTEVRDLSDGMLRIIDTEHRATDHQPRALVSRITHHR